MERSEPKNPAESRCKVKSVNGVETNMERPSNLGGIPPETVLEEKDLARMFQRCTASIRRAVKRGELPRPIRFLGRPRWIAGEITKHLQNMMATEAAEHSATVAKISRLAANG